ncbi:hypothetical protein GFJ94_02395 [Flavobacterium sp. LMO8]|uniref:hypothetical protein n=1 Tax=Flavobacterium sp. LMO8 TaxID=2654244 RepID=UPI00129115E9|nr:hypothetical protein [Flavobacterium sp. LMO8]MQP23911.1 hypothetical protein [Flavobacterium sp. LMO8]
MKKFMKKTFYLYLLFFTQICFSQIPVESYRNEISSLKSIDEVSIYWDKLLDIDQNVLLNEKELIKKDSISTSLMIRTILMFEYQNEHTFKLYKIAPVMNMAHCNNSNSAKLFWPIIEKYKVVINQIMKNYPAYPLESISLIYYGYSLLDQDKIYDRLIYKLQSTYSNEDLVLKLIESHNNFKTTHSLKLRKSIYKWQYQPFKDKKEEGFFEFVKMSDGKWYRRTNYGILQKINLISKKDEFKFYQIEGEPFGWIYKLGKNGSLSLLDNDEILIEYTRIN